MPVDTASLLVACINGIVCYRLCALFPPCGEIILPKRAVIKIQNFRRPENAPDHQKKDLCVSVCVCGKNLNSQIGIRVYALMPFLLGGKWGQGLFSD